MKLLLITVTLLAGAWAQSLSSEYLPPKEDYSVGASNFVETNFLDNEPAHSLADDGYRYRAIKRFRLRHRRDVSELANTYLPPHATSASEPAPAYNTFESVPAPVVNDSYEVEASAPAHTLADDGYRYRTVKRYRLRRRRRDVSEIANEYLPPRATAASAPAPAFNTFESAPVVDDSYEIEASAPAHTLADDGYRYRTAKRYRLRRRRRDVSELANNYLPPQATAASAPAPVVDDSYEVEASAPAHTLTDDGYRYRTVKRYRVRRRRRDVSELANNYLPPHATSASEPALAYNTFESAPAPVVDDSYEIEASAPAHTLADDGYRYRTVKRYRLRRRRRDVSELANNYLPPQATAASAPAPVVDDSYEVEASAPAHTLTDDGYRYRTVKRYRVRRRRRDVSELANNYLPPHATSASEPAPAYNTFGSAPAPVVDDSYEIEASAPAHTLADDGYRYRTVKRYRLRRRRRDVSELANNYLPPQVTAASAPAPAYNTFESAPAPVVNDSYEVESSAPAHTLANDGYRYRTVKRYRLRHRH